MNEPRVYSHSVSEIRAQTLFGVLGAILVLGVGLYDRNYLYFALLAMAGIAFGTLHTSRVKTVLSEEGIFTQNIWGGKSLRWDEISRVSGNSNNIKLHNLDGDVTATPSVELAGYEEVIEIIGAKRPDLFDPTKNPVLKKGREFGVILPAIAVVTIGLGAYIWLTEGGVSVIAFIAFFIIGAIVFGISAVAPQAVKIESDGLQVEYLWGKKAFSAREVTAIELGYQQSRNGKNYFVRINLAGKKPARLIGLSPSTPIVYLILKNWRERQKRSI